MNAIVIDDEYEAREVLCAFLKDFCPRIEVQKTFSDPVKAFDYLKHNHDVIQLIYLDISMPGLDGISFLKLCKDFKLHVIFVTAHDGYAIQAIRLAALDYILKPIDINLLVAASNRALELSQQEMTPRLDVFIANDKIADLDKKLLVNREEELLYIPIRDLIYLEADGNYTSIYAEGRGRIFVTERLGVFEEILAYPFFYRCHRSYLINLKKVDRYIKGRGGQVVMDNGVRIPVSQRNKVEFLERLKLI